MSHKTVQCCELTRELRSRGWRPGSEDTPAVPRSGSWACEDGGFLSLDIGGSAGVIAAPGSRCFLWLVAAQGIRDVNHGGDSARGHRSGWRDHVQRRGRPRKPAGNGPSALRPQERDLPTLVSREPRSLDLS